MTVVKNILFSLGKNKTAKAREEDRYNIEAFCMRTGSRTDMMDQCKASWHQ